MSLLLELKTQAKMHTCDQTLQFDGHDAQKRPPAGTVQGVFLGDITLKVRCLSRCLNRDIIGGDDVLYNLVS